MEIASKGELENALSTVLIKCETDQLEIHNGLGKFKCKVERHSNFFYNTRQFNNGNHQLTIPIIRETPSIVMIFQFGGLSVYRDRFNPFILPRHHHSLNYFNQYDCRTLVDERAHQSDVTISLDHGFYAHVMSELTAEGNVLSEKVLNKTEFNTISAQQPMDAGILGVIHNITNCPYNGPFRETFMIAQIRALMHLQFYQFHHSLTGHIIAFDRRINASDKDNLYAIKSFLDTNYLHDTSLLSLSKQFGINEFKLKYGFKKLFDCSPIKYVQNKRIDFAAMMLKNSVHTVSEISNQISYQHPNNFSVAFRQRYGVSPNRYRNMRFNDRINDSATINN